MRRLLLQYGQRSGVFIDDDVAIARGRGCILAERTMPGDEYAKQYRYAGRWIRKIARREVERQICKVVRWPGAGLGAGREIGCCARGRAWGRERLRYRRPLGGGGCVGKFLVRSYEDRPSGIFSPDGCSAPWV
jgi:hypothetical protein